METTSRLGLGTLVPGQAQKEIAVNEALQALDTVVAAAIEEPARADPPISPIVGSTYIVADGATGDWSGRAGQLPAFSPGGWRFIVPVAGLCAFVKSTGATLRFQNGEWEHLLGARQAAIADVSGGTTVDAEARATITAMLATLRAHGLISA